MKRRSFVKVLSASAAFALVAEKAALFPFRKIKIYYDKNFTSEKSELIISANQIISSFNKSSTVQIELLQKPTNHFIEKNCSFISSPDNFEFHNTILSDLADLTFLGKAKTFEEKLKMIDKLTPAYSKSLLRVGFNPIFLGVGPDLQANIVRRNTLNKFAVYDQKSYLYAQALKAEPVLVKGNLSNYFNNFYDHFDGTAPLYFREFCSEDGLRLSKSMIEVGHYLSPMAFTLYLSNEDVNILGDKNFQFFKDIASDQAYQTSLAMNNFSLKKIIS